MNRPSQKYLMVATAMICSYWVGMGVGAFVALGKTPFAIVGMLIVSAFLIWLPDEVIRFVAGGAPTQEGE